MKFDLRITAAVAGALLAGGCNAPDEQTSAATPTITASDDTAICVDDKEVRVKDELCRDNQAHGSVHPYFIGHGGIVPYYGSAAQGGSSTPDATRSYSAAPASSEITESEATAAVGHSSATASEASEGVSRGGFGATAESFGGAGE